VRFDRQLIIGTRPSVRVRAAWRSASSSGKKMGRNSRAYLQQPPRPGVAAEQRPQVTPARSTRRSTAAVACERVRGRHGKVGVGRADAPIAAARQAQPLQLGRRRVDVGLELLGAGGFGQWPEVKGEEARWPRGKAVHMDGRERAGLVAFLDLVPQAAHVLQALTRSDPRLAGVSVGGRNAGPASGVPSSYLGVDLKAEVLRPGALDQRRDAGKRHRPRVEGSRQHAQRLGGVLCAQLVGAMVRERSAHASRPAGLIPQHVRGGRPQTATAGRAAAGRC